MEGRQGDVNDCKQDNFLTLAYRRTINPTKQPTNYIIRMLHNNAIRSSNHTYNAAVIFFFNNAIRKSTVSSL